MEKIIRSEYTPILTLEYMTTEAENKYFDRKSAGIKPSDLAPHISEFANAEGGIELGLISRDGNKYDPKLTGFNSELTSLGRYEDIKCVYSNEREISIRLSAGKIDKEFLLYRDPVSSKAYFAIDNDQEISDLDFVNRYFQYLS